MSTYYAEMIICTKDMLKFLNLGEGGKGTIYRQSKKQDLRSYPYLVFLPFIHSANPKTCYIFNAFHY